MHSQLIQVAAEYNGLPDIRTLEIWEIRYFYFPLIGKLVKKEEV